MSRGKPYRGDEAEYTPTPRVPDIADHAQSSLFNETQQYLAGAHQRLATLTPVEQLAAAVEKVPGTWASGVAVAMVEGHVRANEQRTNPPREKKKRTKGLTRDRDHATSVEAADSLEPKLKVLQQQVLDAFAQHGAMTDEELEQLPQFARFKYSTVRKRRSELVVMGKLASVKVNDGKGGVTPVKRWNAGNTARMIVWNLAWRCADL